MEKYTPIACAFHDRLEHLAMRRTHCGIEFAENGQTVVAEGIIADIVTAQGAEFIVLEGSGRRIRLDLIREIRPIG